ncbi:MAG: methyltransferase, TrmH family [Thermoleophilaceae bacterium]|jgi:TrmH family RNA methyltransferase|nr:methyltransferase, TrmH family [Thermoleophilaceae bacterium]
MITSPDNEQLKTIRKLAQKKERARTGLFVAEGEDLVDAAAAAGLRPEILLRSGEDVEPALLDKVSALGSGARVIGVYAQRWTEPAGDLCVYLHGVGDPGNVGAVIRSAHALCDGPVILGPGCADPYSPKAVRASMGSVFARPPAKAAFEDLAGTLVALDSGGQTPLASVEVSAPVVLCLGAEREGLPPALVERAAVSASIPIREHGPESLNVAMAATVALYDLGNRMAGHA